MTKKKTLKKPPTRRPVRAVVRRRFDIGSLWDLGPYGLRTIQRVSRRKVPFPSNEIMCGFGDIETGAVLAALEVGSKTLRKCFRCVIQ